MMFIASFIRTEYNKNIKSWEVVGYFRYLRLTTTTDMYFYLFFPMALASSLA